MTQYGEELITNGTFDTDISGWTTVGSWGHDPRVDAIYSAVAPGQGTSIAQTTLEPLKGNSEYLITFNIGYTTAIRKINVYLGSNTVVATQTLGGSTTYSCSYTVRPNGSTNIFKIEVYPTSSAGPINIYFDNISVKEILPIYSAFTKSRGFYGANHGFYR